MKWYGMLRDFSFSVFKGICSCVIIVGAFIAVDAFIPKSRIVSGKGLVLEFVGGVMIASIGMFALRYLKSRK